jgi:hypothetical protein
MSTKNLWWGYLHQNGSLIIKRYLSEDDVLEALESDFCVKIFNPFWATTRQDALNQINNKLKNGNN